MSRWATGKDKKLNIFAYGDDWFLIMAELGGPQVEHELQHILLLLEQQQDSWWQRGRVNRLLDEKDIEALLGHPSQEVRTWTLSYLNTQDNAKALDCLLTLLAERNIEDFICLDGKKIAAFLHSESDYTWKDYIWKMHMLKVMSRMRERQVAEAVLALAQQEELLEQEEEQTNEAYLEGLLTRSELACYFLSGELYLTAATMLGMLGDPRGTALAYQRLVMAQKRNEDLEMKAWVKPGSDKAIDVLCRLSRRGDEQALEVLHRCLFEEHPVPQKVAHAWRKEFFLRTGPGMEIAVYWYDVWSLVDTEGHTRRLVSQPALEKLILEDDPGELVEELLTLWSDETALSAPLAQENRIRTRTAETEEETRRSAVSQILAACAPLLVSKGGEDVLWWRQRLAQLIPGVPW